MSQMLQAKLLRVIEEKRFERLGGRESIASDVRIVAATNQNLIAMMADGRFRGDLYYRLNAVEMVLPPLRERTEDIPMLVNHFIATAAREYGRAVCGIRPEALSKLSGYRWPGNVRELQHVVERAVILARGEQLACDDLPAALRTEAPAATSGIRELREQARRDAVASSERDALIRYLEQADWKVEAAAAAAGYSRAQFYRLMRKHGVATRPGRAARPRPPEATE
jgi:transcriptional regulator with PAS, ATPase and Fis domain